MNCETIGCRNQATRRVIVMHRHRRWHCEGCADFVRHRCENIGIKCVFINDGDDEPEMPSDQFGEVRGPVKAFAEIPE